MLTDYFYFVVFQTIERYSMLFFGLTLFGITINFSRNISMLLLCLSLALSSLLIQEVSIVPNIISDLSAPILAAISCFILAYILKTPFLKTALSVIISTLSLILFQYVMLIFMYDSKIPDSFDHYTHTGQIITFFFYMLISFGIRFITKDAYFMEPDRKYDVKLKYSNGLLVVASSGIFIFAAISFYILKFSNLMFPFYGSATLLLVFILFLAFFFYKREKEEAEIIYNKAIQTLGKGGKTQ